MIVIGLWTGEGVYPIVGFIFVFFLSVFVFMPGNVVVQSGSNLSVSYVYDANGTITSNSVSSVFNYDAFDDTTSKWMARWLAIVSVLGFVLSMIEGAKSFHKGEQ